MATEQQSKHANIKNDSDNTYGEAAPTTNSQGKQHTDTEEYIMGFNKYHNLPNNCCGIYSFLFKDSISPSCQTNGNSLEQFKQIPIKEVFD